jgi:hypothetical protein
MGIEREEQYRILAPLLVGPAKEAGAAHSTRSTIRIESIQVQIRS